MVGIRIYFSQSDLFVERFEYFKWGNGKADTLNQATSERNGSSTNTLRNKAPQLMHPN